MRTHFPQFVLCLLPIFLGFAAVSAVTEKEILLQFKANISIDPYNSMSSWDLSRDPCRGYIGVFCNSDGNVVKIVLWNTSLGGALSPALSGLKSLRILTLFGNRFAGNIPSGYADIGTLWKINLSSNALSGSIPEFIGIDLSFNNLSGGFPSRVCDIPGLLFLSVRSNVLTGSVQEQVSGCRSLELLDLGTNLFSRLAPFELLGLTNLTYFNVSSNGFEGEIPDIQTCSDRLVVFDASKNRFYGKIPLSITKCNTLKVLDLGFNRLNGSVPNKLADLKSLWIIRLGNNLIDGTIPEEFGSIEYLRVLDLHNLNLVGTIPEDISKCRFLLELDLSDNALKGEIPHTLYNMSLLEILDLHGNRLNGSIPSSLSSLSRIKVLDLSNNSLSGSIPDSLGNLKNLTYFNLSYNQLSGTIPSAVQHFGFFAFFHNPGLCGAPLDASCSGNGMTPTSRNPKFSVSAIVAIVAAAVIVTGVCVIIIVNMKVRRRRENKTMVVESTSLALSESNLIIGKLVLFSKSLPSKYEDWEAGTKALLNKECLIGGGSIGTGKFQHPNLVAFQGYYWSSSMQLMLSEFIPNGNLYDNLHRLDFPGNSTGVGNSELNWSRRFKIALGTARALVYLDHDCKPPVLHLNIKSSNILLDENYEAKLSDYGMGKLLPLLDNYGLTKSHNAVGYIAPELGQSLKLTDKYDGYGFGVILLELVTRRKPVESSVANKVVVSCEYVRGLIESGTASDCFDRSLRGFAEDELIQVMKLGLICTSETPSRRPSMGEIVQILESIPTGLEQQ
ncbi:leucine-rich repeat protein kinase family protein [Actinidia rufa]|uniref:Leucine-rich repeat protein kinase family protein n=1 Tax=Actinidia rufa TaxID=165716 RepID=A0A7J0G802_9ERIC|nr:leucine-rich repeat protein kinase family protein [Actinidia rufa]